jgi:hypothetical protein
MDRRQGPSLSASSKVWLFMPDGLARMSALTDSGRSRRIWRKEENDPTRTSRTTTTNETAARKDRRFEKLEE